MSFDQLNMKMESSDLTYPLADDMRTRFESGGNYLGIMPNNEIFSQHNMFMGENEEESEPDDVIILHMDIREPLSTLRTLLEQKIGVDLKKYQFWLQDAQVLEPQKNLVDQCVKGEGLVQINVQIQTISERINIVDVLKPTEAALAALEVIKTNERTIVDDDDTATTGFDENSLEDESDKDDHVINWVLDKKFKKDQARLKIPDDPNDWTSAQVKHWLQWAVRQFNLTQIKLSDWNITGSQLCSLSLEEFQKKVPNDPGNVFWTHLELLRKCKFVTIIQKFVDGEEAKLSVDAQAILKNCPKAIRKSSHVIMKQPALLPGTIGGNYNSYEPSSNRSGNNGQIQLWQFLLDILTDREHKAIIQWQGVDGEFKLSDPERVAQLWGERKNKPAMNYEKLSRALRYYYDGDMISKVHGKRFAYKFVCDLKQLIGYDASELSSLVSQCEPTGGPYDDYYMS